jgi:hypothetical protein
MEIGTKFITKQCLNWTFDGTKGVEWRELECKFTKQDDVWIEYEVTEILNTINPNPNPKASSYKSTGGAFRKSDIAKKISNGEIIVIA